jgi:hypothetical protein
MTKSKRVNKDPILRELDGIKKLLVLFLIKAGASQGEIALALKMDRGDISRMIPARKVKAFSREGNSQE